jgi:hypothetical protein
VHFALIGTVTATRDGSASPLEWLRSSVADATWKTTGAGAEVCAEDTGTFVQRAPNRRSEREGERRESGSIVVHGPDAKDIVRNNLAHLR